MSAAALKKIWGLFALAALTLPFLFFLRTTGAEPKGDDFGILGYKALTIPVLALPMDIVLVGIVLWLTWVWSESVTKTGWSERLPIFHFERSDVDPSSRGGKIYQGLAFFLTMVLPMVLTAQMATKFYGGRIFRHGVDGPVDGGAGHFDFARLSSIKEMLRFGDPQGPEFFAWEPWLFAVLLVALVIAWLVTLKSVFRT